jgi:hypothetical protein
MFGLFEPAAPRRRRPDRPQRRFLDLRRVLPVARQDDDPISKGIALRLLGNPSEVEIEIDRLISYEPTRDQLRRGRSAIWEYLLTDPDLDELNAALGELLRAAQAEDVDWVGLAATRVADEIEALAHKGIDRVCLGRLLGYWSRVTGSPQINIMSEGD